MTEEEKGTQDESLEEEESQEEEKTTEEDSDSGGADEDNEEEEKGGDDFENMEPETRGEEEKKEEKPLDNDEEEIDPEDEKVINRVVDRKLSPIAEKIQKQNDEIEVNTYLVDNPEMAKYKPAILKYASHSAYKNIPISNIAAIVSAKDQQKIGAKKEREARENSDKTKDGSNPTRKTEGKVDWANASLEEVEAQIAKAKGMRV